jgi:hypothetical protein
MFSSKNQTSPLIADKNATKPQLIKGGYVEENYPQEAKEAKV